MRKRTFIGTVLGVLAVSAFSLKSLPWASYWGLDFQNLWLFHHCSAPGMEAPGAPYGVAGAACGDPLGRDLVYPPLLFWVMGWVRSAASFEQAYSIWLGVIALGLVVTFFYWNRSRRPYSYAMLALVLIQYPTVFQLERGNTDIGPVLLVLAACWLWERARPGLAGLAVGLAVSFKLYPVFALAVVAVGVFGRDRRRGPEAMGRGAQLRVLAGMAAGVAISFALFADQARVYFGEVLPRFAAHANPPGLANHSVLPRFVQVPWLGTLLCGTLLAAWMARAWLSLKADRKLVFAGALAISTYFSGVSEDYNLITAFPLLFVLWDRSVRETAESGRYRWLALAGFVAVFGHRQIFVGTSVYFQLAWLVATAAFAGWSKSREAAWASPSVT
jgi:hypothetical protein